MSRIRRVEMQIDEMTGHVSCNFVSCSVSFEEMLEAITRFRDKLSEQIDRKSACPYSGECVGCGGGSTGRIEGMPVCGGCYSAVRDRIATGHAQLPRLVHPPAHVPPPRELRCPKCDHNRFRFPAPSNVATCVACATQVQPAERAETLGRLFPALETDCGACGTHKTFCENLKNDRGVQCCGNCKHLTPETAESAKVCSGCGIPAVTSLGPLQVCGGCYAEVVARVRFADRQDHSSAQATERTET